MSEHAELIVEFRQGVPEDQARSVVSDAKGAVRRRMRSDHPDQVTLLVKMAASAADAVKAALDGHGDVKRTEPNGGGFRIM